MEEVLRYALILYAAAAALAMAFNVGQERATEIDYRKTLVATLVMYALISPGILVWWPTPDLWSAIGKYTVLSLFVADVVGIVVSIKWPRGPVLTTLRGSILIGGALLMLVCTVFLWP